MGSPIDFGSSFSSFGTGNVSNSFTPAATMVVTPSSSFSSPVSSFSSGPDLSSTLTVTAPAPTPSYAAPPVTLDSALGGGGISAVTAAESAAPTLSLGAAGNPGLITLNTADANINNTNVLAGNLASLNSSLAGTPSYMTPAVTLASTPTLTIPDIPAPPPVIAVAPPPATPPVAPGPTPDQIAAAAAAADAAAAAAAAAAAPPPATPPATAIPTEPDPAIIAATPATPAVPADNTVVAPPPVQQPAAPPVITSTDTTNTTTDPGANNGDVVAPTTPAAPPAVASTDGTDKTGTDAANNQDSTVTLVSAPSDTTITATVDQTQTPDQQQPQQQQQQQQVFGLTPDDNGVYTTDSGDTLKLDNQGNPVAADGTAITGLNNDGTFQLASATVDQTQTSDQQQAQQQQQQVFGLTPDDNGVYTTDSGDTFKLDNQGNPVAADGTAITGLNNDGTFQLASATVDQTQTSDQQQAQQQQQQVFGLTPDDNGVYTTDSGDTFKLDNQGNPVAADGTAITGLNNDGTFQLASATVDQTQTDITDPVAAATKAVIDNSTNLDGTPLSEDQAANLTSIISGQVNNLIANYTNADGTQLTPEQAAGLVQISDPGFPDAVGVDVSNLTPVNGGGDATPLTVSNLGIATDQPNADQPFQNAQDILTYLQNQPAPPALTTTFNADGTTTTTDQDGNVVDLTALANAPVFANVTQPYNLNINGQDVTISKDGLTFPDGSPADIDGSGNIIPKPSALDASLPAAGVLGDISPTTNVLAGPAILGQPADENATTFTALDDSGNAIKNNAGGLLLVDGSGAVLPDDQQPGPAVLPTSLDTAGDPGNPGAPALVKVLGMDVNDLGNGNFSTIGDNSTTFTKDGNGNPVDQNGDPVFGFNNDGSLITTDPNAGLVSASTLVGAPIGIDASGNATSFTAFDPQGNEVLNSKGGLLLVDGSGNPLPPNQQPDPINVANLDVEGITSNPALTDAEKGRLLAVAVGGILGAAVTLGNGNGALVGANLAGAAESQLDPNSTTGPAEAILGALGNIGATVAASELGPFAPLVGSAGGLTFGMLGRAIDQNPTAMIGITIDGVPLNPGIDSTPGNLSFTTPTARELSKTAASGGGQVINNLVNTEGAAGGGAVTAAGSQALVAAINSKLGPDISAAFNSALTQLKVMTTQSAAVSPDSGFISGNGLDQLVPGSQAQKDAQDALTGTPTLDNGAIGETVPTNVGSLPDQTGNTGLANNQPAATVQTPADTGVVAPADGKTTGDQTVTQTTAPTVPGTPDAGAVTGGQTPASPSAVVPSADGSPTGNQTALVQPVVPPATLPNNPVTSQQGNNGNTADGTLVPPFISPNPTVGAGSLTPQQNQVVTVVSPNIDASAASNPGLVPFVPTANSITNPALDPANLFGLTGNSITNVTAVPQPDTTGSASTPKRNANTNQRAIRRRQQQQDLAA